MRSGLSSEFTWFLRKPWYKLWLTDIFLYSWKVLKIFLSPRRSRIVSLNPPLLIMGHSIKTTYIPCGRFWTSASNQEWKFSNAPTLWGIFILFITEGVHIVFRKAKQAYKLDIHTPSVGVIFKIFHRGCVEFKWSCPITQK